PRSAAAPRARSARRSPDRRRAEHLREGTGPNSAIQSFLALRVGRGTDTRVGRRGVALDLQHATFVAAAVEWGREPGHENLTRLFGGEEPCREHEHVRVVMTTRELRDLR